MDGSPAVLKPKTHFEILDGLRGVAAIMVVIFHTCEAYADGSPFKQVVNHGYLAVDFFFLLSGFVVAYAYDDRWGKMTPWDFCKRRLIRLQPMVIAGNMIGAALFYFQVAPVFPHVATTPVWKMLLVMLLGFTMLPLLPSMDIRGWGEMHPLDGPAWVTRDHIPAARGAVVGVLLLLTAIAIAYACLKLYDEPVREWLRRRFLVTGASA